jgi:hypothetical protein
MHLKLLSRARAGRCLIADALSQSLRNQAVRFHNDGALPGAKLN